MSTPISRRGVALSAAATAPKKAGARSGRGQLLHDSDLNAMNTFDNPTRIAIKPLEVGVEANRLKVTLPAMSVATVTLQIG